VKYIHEGGGRDQVKRDALPAAPHRRGFFRTITPAMKDGLA
jgi:hypothetical protein